MLFFISVNGPAFLLFIKMLWLAPKREKKVDELTTFRLFKYHITAREGVDQGNWPRAHREIKKTS